MKIKTDRGRGKQIEKERDKYKRKETYSGIERGRGGGELKRGKEIWREGELEEERDGKRELNRKSKI